MYGRWLRYRWMHLPRSLSCPFYPPTQSFTSIGAWLSVFHLIPLPPFPVNRPTQSIPLNCLCRSVSIFFLANCIVISLLFFSRFTTRSILFYRWRFRVPLAYCCPFSLTRFLAWHPRWHWIDQRACLSQADKEFQSFLIMVCKSMRRRTWLCYLGCRGLAQWSSEPRRRQPPLFVEVLRKGAPDRRGDIKAAELICWPDSKCIWSALLSLYRGSNVALRCTGGVKSCKVMIPDILILILEGIEVNLIYVKDALACSLLIVAGQIWAALLNLCWMYGR